MLKNVSYTSQNATATKPILKFADVSMDLFYKGFDIYEPQYKSNVEVKVISKCNGKEYYLPAFTIYSYKQDSGVWVWGLTSPFLDNPRFYKDFETAHKWAHILYDQIESLGDYVVYRSAKIKWYSNSGTKKCPIWDEHCEYSFFYENPMVSCDFTKAQRKEFKIETVS